MSSTPARATDHTAETADHEWREAMRARDVSTLRRLLRPDAVIVHHDGRVDTGEAYLDRIERGGPRIVEFAMAEGAVSALGETVVVTGWMDATVDRAGALHPLVATVSRTWVLYAGRWSLIATASSGH